MMKINFFVECLEDKSEKVKKSSIRELTQIAHMIKGNILLLLLIYLKICPISR